MTKPLTRPWCWRIVGSTDQDCPGEQRGATLLCFSGSSSSPGSLEPGLQFTWKKQTWDSGEPVFVPGLC